MRTCGPSSTPPQWAVAPDGFDLSPAFPRAQLRQTVAKEAGIRGEDAFALLEYLGTESAGSLTLVAPGQALPDEARLQLLPDEALSGRIQALPRQTLAKTSPKRMSLAGCLYEPEGAMPSTHILKPEHPDVASYPASVFNEFLTMRLARAARLSVPAVAMRYVPQPVYLIERFDRVIDPRSLAGKDLVAERGAAHHPAREANSIARGINGLRLIFPMFSLAFAPCPARQSPPLPRPTQNTGL